MSLISAVLYSWLLTDQEEQHWTFIHYLAELFDWLRAIQFYFSVTYYPDMKQWRFVFLEIDILKINLLDSMRHAHHKGQVFSVIASRAGGSCKSTSFNNLVTYHQNLRSSIRLLFHPQIHWALISSLTVLSEHHCICTNHISAPFLWWTLEFVISYNSPPTEHLVIIWQALQILCQTLFSTF